MLGYTYKSFYIVRAYLNQELQHTMKNVRGSVRKIQDPLLHILINIFPSFQKFLAYNVHNIEERFKCKFMFFSVRFCNNCNRNNFSFIKMNNYIQLISRRRTWFFLSKNTLSRFRLCLFFKCIFHTSCIALHNIKSHFCIQQPPIYQYFSSANDISEKKQEIFVNANL